VSVRFKPLWEILFLKRKSAARSMRRAKDVRAAPREENKK
jgi:hypothetical protein